MRRVETLSKVKVETSEGSIFFSIVKQYEGATLLHTIYGRVDDRDGVLAGQSYFEYINEKSYKSAIKRAIKKYN